MSCYVLCPGGSCSFWFLHFSDPSKAPKIETEIIFKLREPKIEIWFDHFWGALQKAIRFLKFGAKCALAGFFLWRHLQGIECTWKMAKFCLKMAAFKEAASQTYNTVSRFKLFSLFLVELESTIPKKTTKNNENWKKFKVTADSKNEDKIATFWCLQFVLQGHN